MNANNPRPIAPGWRRFGGSLIAALGAYLTWIAHAQARAEEEFSMRAAMLGPAFAVLGLALLLFRGYREERLARGEDIRALSGSALITPRWWGVVAVAMLAGALHVAWLAGWLG